MSHLLRRPAAVPALFSQPGESDPAPRRGRAGVRIWTEGAVLLICPTLLLSVEFPLIRNAAALLRIALPH